MRALEFFDPLLRGCSPSERIRFIKTPAHWNSVAGGLLRAANTGFARLQIRYLQSPPALHAAAVIIVYAPRSNQSVAAMPVPIRCNLG